MIAVCVDPKRINEAWPHFRAGIKVAIDRVGITPFESIERDVLNGHKLLWLAYEDPVIHAAAVTQIWDDVCEIVACAGKDLKKFIPRIKDLEDYARSENCRAMRLVGRKGWTRVLKQYDTKAIILEGPL